MAGSLTQIFNPIGDAMDAANSMLNTADKYLQQDANFKLRAMANQLEQDTNDMLLKMQQNNDYESWPGDVNDFLQERVKDMGNRDSKYFCNNGYMARQFKQILDDQRPQLLMKAEQAKLGKEREHRINLSNQEFENNLVNGLYTQQEQLDKRRENLKSLLDMQDITETQFNQQMDIAYQKIYTSSVLAALDKASDKSIANNMTFNQMYEAYEKENPEGLKMYDLDGLERSIDASTLKANVKKMAEQNYKAKVNDLQTKNATWHSEKLTDIYNADTDTDALVIARNALAYLTTQDGLQMDEGRRNFYAEKYRTIIKNNGSRTGSSGSGSLKLDSLSTLTDHELSVILEDVNKGNISFQEAADGFNNWFTKEYYSKPYKETKDIYGNYEAMEQYRNNNYKDIGAMKLLDNTKINALIKQNYPDAWNLYQDAVKLIENDKVAHTPDAYKTLSEVVLKIGANVTNETTQDDILKSLKVACNSVILDNMNLLYTNDETKKQDMEAYKNQKNLLAPQNKGFLGINSESDDEYIGRTAKELQENDLIYVPNGKDIKRDPSTGKPISVEKEAKILPGYEDKIKAVQEKQLSVISQVTGIPANRLKPEFQLKEAIEGGRGKNDRSSVIEWRDTQTDNVYSITPTETNGKVTGYDVQQKIFNDNQTSYKSLGAANNYKDKKANIKNAANDLENLKNERGDKVQATISEAKTMPNKLQKVRQLTGKGATANDWRDYTDLEKTVAADDFIGQLDTLAKKAKKESDISAFKIAVGMTPEEWLQMNHNKTNLVMFLFK